MTLEAPSVVRVSHSARRAETHNEAGKKMVLQKSRVSGGALIHGQPLRMAGALEVTTFQNEEWSRCAADYSTRA